MMKLMNMIAAATVAAGAASPVLANDPFVSSQNGEDGVKLTPTQTAGLVAGTIGLAAVISGGDNSSSTTTTTTGS